MEAHVVSHHPLSRGPLIAIGAMLLVVLLAVTTVRLSGMNISVPDAAAVAIRDLRFEDRADGSIAVIDARSGAELESIVGEQGFIRGTLRGLARERKRQGIGADVAFQLVGRADGRLTLIDPATNRRVDLDSFGPTNAGAFVKLLDVARSPEMHASGAPQ
ncbi:MAG: photosynthetic complex assembly protein PuhC [Methyloversatilis sp.]|uniref:photosynthetic complex assembly protein PuhC n=1 Tax=Methyloversatilis sp. TaxID=2569862 RepID=UPI002736C0DA|nr:photosynthetic complex assembly protein PuhC [Methyloversatilis sp.]MDP3872524.1 photosynthetic complex assembly protein PuhC [Methyloversatilis sp.]